MLQLFFHTLLLTIILRPSPISTQRATLQRLPNGHLPRSKGAPPAGIRTELRFPYGWQSEEGFYKKGQR